MGRLGALLAGWLRPGPMLLALSVVTSMAMDFSFRILPVLPGVDGPFAYGFNYAAAHRLKWGLEFISTYGPYGHLVQTMDLGSLVWSKLLFNLLLALGLGVATTAYLRSAAGLSTGARLALMPAIVYASTIQDPEYRWFTFFLLVFLAGLLTGGWASLAAYGLAGLLGGFYLLIKFSIGFATIVTLVLGCALVRRPLVAAGRLTVTACAVTVAFVIGWISSGGGRAGIVPYLTLGWELSSGYSSGASLHGGRWWVDVASFLVAFALLLLWVLLKPGPRSRIALAGLAFPLFTAWKHSIVRQDEHVAILARFGVFVVIILFAEAAAAWPWRYTLPAAAAVLVPVVLPWATMTTPVYGLTAGEMVVNPFAFRGLKDLAALTQLTAYREAIAQTSASALRRRTLPASMRDRIGASPVDVYPWDASYVPANRLTWANRPLPFSYNGWTPALDGLNAAFFRSPRRPEYLVWHRGFARGVWSIDGRHLLWDEPQTVRAIVDHYEVVDADGSVMLLRTRSSPRFGTPQPLGTSRVQWDTWVAVPGHHGVLLATPSMEPSRILRLVRGLFREEPLWLSVRFGSGQSNTYRLLPDNMGSGVWLSPLPIAFEEMPPLLQESAGRRVVAMRFGGDVLVRTLVPSISVSWSQMLPLRDSRNNETPPPNDGAWPR